MGNCCTDKRDLNEEISIVVDDFYSLKEKIYKIFRLNPFHNYGSRRQLLLEKDFEEHRARKLKEEADSSNILSDFLTRKGNLNLNKFEKNLINLTIKCLKVLIKEFASVFEERNSNNSPHNQDKTSNTSHINNIYPPSITSPETLLLNILMFVLSNTKNNSDKKQEIVIDIINASFLNEEKIDLEKFKKYVKNLVQISLQTFIIVIMLQVFEEKEKIEELQKSFDKSKNANHGEVSTKMINVCNLIIGKINLELGKKYSYSKLTEIWEEYLMAPIIFAGYSNEKNIANYNKKLREDIIKRFNSIFDPEVIINSLIKQKIDNY